MPIQQHPVPQHISSYEFRLVGDMTLKQFGWLAGGVVVGLIFYGLPLRGIIKWPLALTSGFVGFAFAFMPIEERPLSTWLFAFIKAVFSPTLFIWQKKPQKLEIFEPIVHQPVSLKAPPPNVLMVRQYLTTLPQVPAKNPLDQKEEEHLRQIAALFPATKTSPKPITSPPPVPPKKEVLQSQPSPSPFQKPSPKPPAKPPIEAFIYRQFRKPRKPAIEAKTSKELPIPIPPPAPNIISGMVFDKNGEIVEGAILEIRNPEGIPVRALKTNKLGQFIIATPLENGQYEIEVEKEGLNFDIIKFEAKGEMIPPFEIRAK